MRMYDLILKKREGGCLTESEINYIVKGYTQGSIPDYQMSAFLMAVYFKGLSDEETFALTKAMTDSGEKLDLYRELKLINTVPVVWEIKLHLCWHQ